MLSVSHGQEGVHVTQLASLSEGGEPLDELAAASLCKQAGA